MKRYTEEEVATLVKEATQAAKLIKLAYTEGVDGRPCGRVWRDLSLALKPFLPDPEEELVEAMAWKYCEEVGGTVQSIEEVSKGMRSCLSLLKSRGLLKELT